MMLRVCTFICARLHVFNVCMFLIRLVLFMCVNVCMCVHVCLYLYMCECEMCVQVFISLCV